MTIPSLLPDELARGYLGRVARMNMLSNLEQTYCLLRAALPNGVGAPQPDRMVHVLSEIAGVSSDAVVTQHTMGPFIMAVRGAASCAPHSERDDKNRRNALTFPRTWAKDFHCCLRCIQEDAGFHGVSYWRRSHQLKGVVFCSKHGCGLHSAVIRRWSDFPEDLFEVSKAIDQEVVDDALRNPVICRYEEICSMLALRPRPFPMEVVSRLIRDRAQIVCPPGPNGSLRLTPLAVEKASGPWLASHFPGLQERRRTGHVDSLDRIVGTPNVPLATQYYALALALLFDSSDEAMYCVTQAERNALPLIGAAAGDDRTEGTINQLATRLGEARIRAIHAVLAGSSIRDAAKVAGVLGPDLEALVIACAVERLTLLSQHVH